MNGQFLNIQNLNNFINYNPFSHQARDSTCDRG